MYAAAQPNLRHQLKQRLLALPPRAFELFAGDLLEFIGMRGVVVTRYSGDGGIDATGYLETSAAQISIPTGVQVKRYRSNVQRSDIDRFIGALSGCYAQGLFITTAGYSRQAALKADAGIPHISLVNGDQVVALMLQHQLGVHVSSGTANQLDEAYFGVFEAQAVVPRHVKEHAEIYRAQTEAERIPQAEDDLISMRALSHAIGVDTTTLRHWIDKGQLHADRYGSAGRGYLFRRDRIEIIRAELLGRARPANAEAWRQEFLAFARSRNLTKSYKPVLLKALLDGVDRNGEIAMDALVAQFRAFYVARKQAGLVVEFGPPNIANTQAVNDDQLRQLIIKHPLERFRIQGFLEYQSENDAVRFAPQLWHELRVWELLDLKRSADEQLAYYYNRAR